ncbi:putative sugar O-methyltransferase [Bradyrhizobium sp. CB1650]|uniref:putative sugar O-methyltransferase n=1 Tax=Bradyrhizobium sp. CB1650 TaxID=3039153 RepID=UPI0024359975|nr:putative sugar O-methyltransferase [Bradyrhizobium sp. CB1650]WGD54938.1 putative sugar O-methyltransferase [Bradyrhizobium sp. CB1650]
MDAHGHFRGAFMIRNLLSKVNDAAGEALGLRLVREQDLYPWQFRQPRGSCQMMNLPPSAEDYLRPDNPRLRELKERYGRCDARVTTPAIWEDGILATSDISHFRRDNAFVWQERRGTRFNELAYAASYYALKASDACDLLTLLEEDGFFGAHVFSIDGRQVSRDLLDSVREIDFVRKHMDLVNPRASILDIGAGYGRLPYRLSRVTQGTVNIYATDAIAESTFVSEFYLKFRAAEGVSVVPLDRFETFIASTPIDLAINIHSFSECSLTAIDWWVERLSINKVKRLLVIPNHADVATQRCLTNRGEDMELIFERHGYAAIIREPRYPDSILQRYGIDPSLISLFELSVR